MSEKYEGKIESREFLPDQNDGGIGISGRWLNKRTGQTINIRNSVMDGDNMIIITDKGQISMTEFSRDYIQASDDIYDETGKVIGHEEVKPEVEVEEGMLEIEVVEGMLEIEVVERMPEVEVEVRQERKEQK